MAEAEQCLYCQKRILIVVVCISYDDCFQRIRGSRIEIANFNRPGVTASGFFRKGAEQSIGT